MSDQTKKITPEQLEAEIVGERYFTAAEGVMGAYAARGGVHPHGGTPSVEEHDNLALLTFCVLVLRNGCKVVGVNHGPVVPAGFDEAYGRKDAREDAIRQVWPLLGFRLRDRLQVIENADHVLRRIDCGCASDRSCAKCAGDTVDTHDLQVGLDSNGIAACTRCGCSNLAARRWTCEAMQQKQQERRAPCPPAAKF